MKRLYSQNLHSKNYWHSSSDNYQHKPSRIILLMLVSVGLFFGLALRLFHLQVVQGANFRQRSDNNRILLRQIPAARGVIYDSKGEALVSNQPVQRLLTDSTGAILLDSPILTRDEVLRLEATQSGRLVTTVGRYYPFKQNAAHVVGYVAEASQEELETSDLILGEMIGKAGLEKSFNQELMGIAGSEVIELNAQGKVLRRIGQLDPQPGLDLQLHLDIELQKKAVEALGNRPGAVVVSRPNTGAILALVSSPSYDPNLFGFSDRELGVSQTEESHNELASLLTDENRPLVDRAISGAYPPGSVYKIVPSIGGLENEVIEASTEVEDTGVITIDQYQFRNWYWTQYGRNEGLVDLTTALQRSNDIYYYKVGEWLGIDALAEWSRAFGLGTETGIDLPGEVAGLVPDPVWKERVKNERWFLGNTYHMAIGQGDLLTTPLQVNQMMGVVANGGRLCKPQLVDKIGDKDQVGAECREVGIHSENLERVVEGLIAACQQGGTAYPFFDFSLNKLNQKFSPEDLVACKTGTAQFFDPEDRTHAWFTIFAPAKNPEIEITVLVEAAGEGSAEAAPVAKQILEWWAAQQTP